MEIIQGSIEATILADPDKIVWLYADGGGEVHSYS